MFTVTDIKRLGITDPDHLNKIATSLAELRDRSDTPSSLFTGENNSLTSLFIIFCFINLMFVYVLRGVMQIHPRVYTINISYHI